MCHIKYYIFLLVFMGGFGIWFVSTQADDTLITTSDIIKLPEPKLKSDVSIEEALLARRSTRSFQKKPLTLSEVSQLLWAAQGINRAERGLRTAPSAGALYPLELYVAVGNVDQLANGVYKYIPATHDLMPIASGDAHNRLSQAALRQSWLKESAIVLVWAAVYERTTQKYGERGIQYVHIEVGHSAQNVFLQAAALGLGAGVIGAFDDDAVKTLMQMFDEETPVYLMPVGHK